MTTSCPAFSSLVPLLLDTSLRYAWRTVVCIYMGRIAGGIFARLIDHLDVLRYS